MKFFTYVCETVQIANGGRGKNETFESPVTSPRDEMQK